MKITINTNNTRKKQDYIKLITAELNLIINSPDFFSNEEKVIFSNEEKVIVFECCANSEFHNKLIGILCLYLANKEGVGYIVFNSPNSIVVHDAGKLYDFVSKIGNIQDVNIEIN